MTAPKSDAPLPKPKKTEHLATLLIYAAAMLLGAANGLWGTEFMHSVADMIATVFVRLFKFISINRETKYLRNPANASERKIFSFFSSVSGKTL